MPIAILLAALGGAVNGSFAAPLKRMHGWAWEHSWFVWSISALILAPGITALLTVPRLADVYAASSWEALGLVMLFGFLWGIAGLLFGLSIDRLGLAIGFGIVLGISSALGAIGPLVAQHSEEIFTRTGLLTLGGVILIVCGVISCAVSGRIREKTGGGGRKGPLAVGLLIAVTSGLLAPMMNFGLAYGSEIAGQARLAGAGDGDAVNAIWPVLLIGGFLPNALYCAWLMFRSSGWLPLIETRPYVNFSLGLLMGLLWMGGLTIYGYASRLLGPLGLVLGWPVMMACTVLTAQAWGVVNGEWKGAPGAAMRWVSAGVFLLIAGTIVISLASRA